MGLVFEAEGLDGPEKLLLLAYCNRTDDHGYCWPGQKRLVDDCGTSAATVKRVKKSLVDKGLISSVRRVNPVTGDPITNLTRVNLKLLTEMARPRTVYDDNVIEQITFAEDLPVPKKQRKSKSGKGSDLLLAQNEPDPDLLMAHVEPTPGSSWAHPRLNMSPPPAHVEPLTLIDPSEIPQPSLRPSAAGVFDAGASRVSAPDGGTEGRKDGGRREVGQAVERTPGVEVLLAIGREKPEWLLTGEALRDQGAAVSRMLEQGFTPQQVRQVIVSRSLPDPLTHTVGAVVGRRLRDLEAGGPLTGVRCIPTQGPTGESGFGWAGAERSTTTAADRSIREAADRRVHHECQGLEGLCGRPVPAEGELCSQCSPSRERVQA
ncbi:helix-turn-helix domain-containing protein [Streptomyces sp. NPDC056437]|uniref:helix-turn-helix domain-containing protein n=1 Tax=Streptomyces sp. NPDC056437 TaxID=3345816 RepID=UPI00369F5F26